MKILLLTASLRGGGAERVQITLAGAFHDLGHDALLVSLEDDGMLCVDDGVRLVRLGAPRVSRAIPALAKLLKAEKPDLVIAAMVHVGQAALLARFLSGWRGPVLVRADGSLLYAMARVGLRQRFVLGTLQRCLLPRAQALIGVSSAIAEEYRQLIGLQNCQVIPNPVPSVATGHLAAPAHVSYQSGDPVIVSLGRLHPVKGFPFLVRTFAELRRTTAARLVILGEGSERPEIETLVQNLGLTNEVELPGFVDDIAPFLQHAAVCAVSSVSEAFGLTVVEAMGHGTPVVSTDTAGPREILRGGELGDLIPHGDTAAFARALQRAIAAPHRGRELRIARAADYRPERIAARYLELMGDGTNQ